MGGLVAVVLLGDGSLKSLAFGFRRLVAKIFDFGGGGVAQWVQSPEFWPWNEVGGQDAEVPHWLFGGGVATAYLLALTPARRRNAGRQKLDVGPGSWRGYQGTTSQYLTTKVSLSPSTGSSYASYICHPNLTHGRRWLIPRETSLWGGSAPEKPSFVFLRSEKPPLPIMMRLFALYFLFLLAARADDCPPATWQAKGSEGASNPKTPKHSRSTLVTTADKKIQPGDVNCRYSSTTSATVNYDTCTQMATKYGTAVDHFFMLNPTLELDCSNIQPKTEYCVDGCQLPPSHDVVTPAGLTRTVIEPLRATDGRCGPPNRNATCLGMPHGQCCNSETWTCGNSA